MAIDLAQGFAAGSIGGTKENAVKAATSIWHAVAASGNAAYAWSDRSYWGSRNKNDDAANAAAAYAESLSRNATDVADRHARDADQAAGSPASRFSKSSLADAAEHAANAVCTCANTWAQNVRSKAQLAIVADYQAIDHMNLGTFPDLGDPIDPSEHGPLGSLWPAGKPDWSLFERLG
jgi:hypothetical protein